MASHQRLHRNVVQVHVVAVAVTVVVVFVAGERETEDKVIMYSAHGGIPVSKTIFHVFRRSLIFTTTTWATNN